MILNNFTADEAEADEASAVFYNMEVYTNDADAVRDLIYTIRLERLRLMIAGETDPARLGELFKQQQELLEGKNTWEE